MTHYFGSLSHVSKSRLNELLEFYQEQLQRVRDQPQPIIDLEHEIELALQDLCREIVKRETLKNPTNN